MSKESVAVHILNLPVGVRWRQVKAELLLASGIPEETVLHIQVLDRACVVTLNSHVYADILVDELDGATYHNMVLLVRTEDQLNADGPFLPPPGPPLQQHMPPLSPPQMPAYNGMVYPYFPQQHFHMGPGPPPGPPPPPPSGPPGPPRSAMGPPGDFYPQMYQIPLPPPPMTVGPPIGGGIPLNTSASYNYRTPQSNYQSFMRGPLTSSTSNTSLMSGISSPSVSPRMLNSLRQYPYQTITDLEPIPDKTRLFIGNIPYASEWKDLKDYLRNAGDIQRVEIPSESNGASKGFAIATFATENDAIRAIEMFNGVSFQGRALTVRFDRFPIKREKEQELDQSAGSIVTPDLLGINLINVENVNSQKDEKEEEKEIVKKIETKKAETQSYLKENIPDLVDSKDEDKRFEDEARSLIESLNIGGSI